MKLLLRFLKPYRPLIALTLLVIFIDDAGTMLVPTMLANMINAGIADADMNEIVRGGLEMFVVSLVASGNAILALFLSAELGAKVSRDIRDAIYEASLKFSAADFEHFGTGSMITRSLGDINVVQQAIVMFLQMVLPVPFLSIVGIALAWSIAPQLGILVAAMVAVVLTVAVFTVRKSAPIFTRLQGYIDSMNTRLRESIIGVRVIRAFNKERRDEARLGEVFGEYADNAIKVNYLFATLDCTTFCVMNIAEVLIIWLGGNLVGAHAMEIASISAVVEYAMVILFFIMMAQMVMLSLPRAMACLERAREVIEYEPSIVDAPGAASGFDVADEAATSEAAASANAKADAAAGDGAAQGEALTAIAGESATTAVPVAAFKDVCFRFEDADEYTLRSIDFRCKRGKTTAIIGSTGSGKSTIAKLLLRLHDVTTGELDFNGVDVRDLTQVALRDRIAYVPQKAWLFSGTVADNLRYGNEDATEADMIHALEVAQSTFVLDLPEGLQSHVAQGGTNFSGGQRQRLAIARALMKHADLYIFDDSFSALDFKTDAALRAALVDETQDAAVLIIAQRVSTILHADQIVVLKDGRIEGKGTHEELMEGCAVYQDIAASQMKGGE